MNYKLTEYLPSDELIEYLHPDEPARYLFAVEQIIFNHLDTLYHHEWMTEETRRKIGYIMEEVSQICDDLEKKHIGGNDDAE